MKAKKIVAALVFADFVALNAWAFYRSGVSGFLAYLDTMGPWGMVLGADLVIALGMVLTWLWADAKKKGRSAFGYTALTVALGSVGTLLYVLLGSDERKPAR